MLHLFAKLRIFSGISKEYFQVVHTEETAVAYLAALSGGKGFLWLLPEQFGV